MDTDTRRKKQQALMTELLERKIRLHAQNIYEKRGQAEGLEVQDWVQAESEVLEKITLAPIYRKSRTDARSSDEFEDASNSQSLSTDSQTSEADA